MKCVVGIVIGEGQEHVHPCCTESILRLTIHIAACGIGGAVRAVAADRKDTAVFQTGKSRCGGQSKLLIPSAQAFAGQVDDRLTACDIGQLPAMSGMGAGDRAKETARFPGFTAELVGQDDRLMPVMMVSSVFRNGPPAMG